MTDLPANTNLHRKLMRLLIALAVGIHSLHLAGIWLTTHDASFGHRPWAGFLPIIQEARFAHWFNASLFLVCATLAAFWGLANQARPLLNRWTLAGSGLLLLSMNEATGVLNDFLSTPPAHQQHTFSATVLSTQTFIAAPLLKTIGSLALARMLLGRLTSTQKPLWNQNLSAQQTIFRFSILAITVVFAGIASQWAFYTVLQQQNNALIHQLALSGQNNLAAWFNSFLLLVAGAYSLAAAMRAKQSDRPTRLWWVLAFVFIAMSAEELVALHTVSFEPLQKVWQIGGVLHAPWILTCSLLIGGVLCTGGWDLLRLPRKITLGLIFSGAIFVTGGLGMEIASGYWADHFGEMNFVYQLLTGIEELLELLGLSFYIGVVVSAMNTPAVVKIPLPTDTNTKPQLVAA